MKYILLFGLFFSLRVFSQEDSSYVSTTVETKIYTMDFLSSKKKLNEFIVNNSIKIQDQNENKTYINANFVLSENQYKKYENMISDLGYVSSKKINTVNNYSKVKEIRLELAFLIHEKESYENLLKKIDEQSDKYLSLWRENKAIEEKIHNKERDLLFYGKKENTYSVNINIAEEITSPENTKVAFINMPGLEYSYLKIESPLDKISSSVYQGYFLKYLFTKGKSFASIGAYKSIKTNAADSTQFSELFLFSFGQDFYSRHFGRGSRKFLNLYSGYNIGGVLAANSNSVSTIPFLSPSVGVELFKNKYILLDTKVCYFIPFVDNRNLRGLSFNTSFNFVF